ncbi:MAG: hypothetical protein U9R79_06610 [Armatimonadota bacterium]|nr:hypothetical protein [Armatimonadota bacterium]
MEIIFSFDTEDYVDPVSNDALLRLAQIHSDHGVPGVFGLVGEKARFIHFCGRHDVVEALRDHEVGYHSDHHWILPDWDYERRHVPDYVANVPWDRAVTRIIAEEARGLADIEDIFGRRPVTQLRNYGDWTPQVMVSHARLGIPVHAYGPVFHNTDPEPVWYCNQLQIANPRHMYEDNLHDFEMTPEEKLEQHRQNVLRHLEEGTHRLGWVTHPTRFIADTWWEEPNWWGTMDDPPRRDWRAPERFSDETIQELLWIADGLVEFVASLDDVQPRTFREFAEEYRPTRVWVMREEILRLAGLVGDRPAMVLLEGESFSPAELFGVFAHALGAPEGGAAYDRSPLRRIIGPTEAPMETEAGEASRDALLDAAREAELFVRDRARVPHRIRVGRGQVGPGAFLLAMAQALREPDAERIPIPAAHNLPEEYRESHYEAIETQGWPLGYIQFQQDKSELDFSSIREHARLQYWTFKVATRTTPA